MRVPVIQGVIERRILVNYRINPEALKAVLPTPLRPKVIRGSGIGGICLIRLAQIRPRGFPKLLGIGSENAAHRIAVLLPDGREGVFIPRRDTSSKLNAFIGGRFFPGVHHRALFQVKEQEHDQYCVAVRSNTGECILTVSARCADDIPFSSVFESLQEASAFFESGSLGYSPSRSSDTLDGLELRTASWNVQPLDVLDCHSAFFEDATRFPGGTAQLDCALLMHDVQHEWHSRKPLHYGVAQSQ